MIKNFSKTILIIVLMAIGLPMSFGQNNAQGTSGTDPISLGWCYDNIWVELQDMGPLFSGTVKVWFINQQPGVSHTPLPKNYQLDSEYKWKDHFTGNYNNERWSWVRIRIESGSYWAEYYGPQLGTHTFTFDDFHTGSIPLPITEPLLW